MGTTPLGVGVWVSAVTLFLAAIWCAQADLIRRDRSDKSLDGLRKRLRNLFLQFIETPEFNPEVCVRGCIELCVRLARVCVYSLVLLYLVLFLFT